MEHLEQTICELFAGVGGFRVGFDRSSGEWDTVWFSQWEPEKKNQYAYDCYVQHFETCNDLDGRCDTANMNISLMDKRKIPDHNVLVGGFPCQDYSVAHSLSSSNGIEGKKGVLWWQIRDTLEAKRPAFCLFENVDRLLKSPAKQRGRDFGIILSCLNSLGYSAEWRVIDASTYGGAQRRRRTFIFCYRNDTNYATQITPLADEPYSILRESGFMARSFPVSELSTVTSCVLPNSILEVSDKFVFTFLSAGIMSDGMIYTANAVPKFEPSVPLLFILEKDVAEKYYVTNLDKWKYLKGSKRIERTSRDGHTYTYSEGAIAFPDSLDLPGRTMLTSEGSLNRCSHLIRDPETERFRILTPVEAERLNGFDDNWTVGMPERMRYFCMGNALVVPMITRMAKELALIIGCEP